MSLMSANSGSRKVWVVGLGVSVGEDRGGQYLTTQAVWVFAESVVQVLNRLDGRLEKGRDVWLFITWVFL